MYNIVIPLKGSIVISKEEETLGWGKGAFPSLFFFYEGWSKAGFVCFPAISHFNACIRLYGLGVRCYSRQSSWST